MKKIKFVHRNFVIVILLAAGLILFFAGGLILIPAAQYSFFTHRIRIINPPEPLSASDVALLKNKAEKLTQTLNRLSSPGNAFLVINTSANSFRLYRKHQMVGTGLCSTGSLIHLQVDSTRSWIFETPKGEHRVRNKITDPVWRKPDWAFIEEGLQPPPPDHASRFERGVLGDYALDLGNGYLIHGTLYQRLLGMSVTHGRSEERRGGKVC